jgi:hypothetical protein
MCPECYYRQPHCMSFHRLPPKWKMDEFTQQCNAAQAAVGGTNVCGLHLQAPRSVHPVPPDPTPPPQVPVTRLVANQPTCFAAQCKGGSPWPSVPLVPLRQRDTPPGVPGISSVSFVSKPNTFVFFPRRIRRNHATGPTF